MENLKPIHNYRTCIVCENYLFGRSDKVFCGITCKNRYHSELAKSQKTIAKETFKILAKNWTILSTLMGSGVAELHINKVELARHGFDYTTVSGVDITLKNLCFDVFEYTWSHKENNEIRITLNKKQIPISPFIFKRWRYRYTKDDYQDINTVSPNAFQQRNST